MNGSILKRLLTWFWVFTFSILPLANTGLPAKADSLDPFQRQDSFNSGVVDGHFNPDIKKQWGVSYYPYPGGMPLISGNTVFYVDKNFGSATITLRALELYSKASLWNYPLDYSKATCAPVYHQEIIYICEDEVLAIDAKTGIKLRSFPKPQQILKYYKLTIADNLLLAFASYGTSAELKAFDLTTNTLSWQRVVTGVPLEAVIIRDHRIFFNTHPYHSHTEAINLNDGSTFWQAKHYGSVGKLVLLEGARKLYDLSRNWAMDIDTGAISSGDVGWQGWPFAVEGNKWISYFNGDTSINFMSRNASTGGWLANKQYVVNGQTITSNQLMADGKIYFVTSKQNLLEMDTAGNLLSSHQLDTSDPLAGKNIIVDHGRFFVYNTSHGGYEFQYYDHEPVVIQDRESFALKSPYTNTSSLNPYLGQLHSHYIPDVPTWSKLFNGEPTPAFTEQKYKDAGYDFVALTEHNKVIDDPGIGGILHIVNSEEDTQDLGGNHILSIGIQEPIDETKYDQERIDQVVNQGGIPILAHLNSSYYPWTLDSLRINKRYNHLEVKNMAMSRLDPLYYYGSSESFDKWDNLLGGHKNIFGTAGDDYTPGDGGFDGAAVVVFSETKTQADIMKNLKSGNFYALQGSEAPRINVSADNKMITVTASQTADFKFIGKGGKTLKEENSVSSSTYSVVGDEVYVRTEVEAGGKKAWSQPIFVDPNPSSQTVGAGMHTFDLGQAKALTYTDAEVSAGILDENQKPEDTPPLGYLSPVYSFATGGTVLPGTELAISYDGRNLSTNESNLSIFTFNEATTHWEKVVSAVNIVSKIVTASLSHFSLYTLSAEVPEDTTVPVISLASPTVLTDLQGEVPFTFEITDDNAVVSTGFAVDDNPVEGSKIEDTNTYTVNIDTNILPSGSHKLQVYAEDFKGNKTEKEFDFTVQSSFVLPEINLTAPTLGDYLYEASNLSGTFTSSLPVSEIQLYLDDIYIENLEPTENGFEKLIDWSQFKEGVHKLRVVLRDVKGNEGVVEREISIGQKIEATIVSPEVKNYQHSSQIPIEIKAKPENAVIIVKLDGEEVANHSIIQAINLSLGEHKIEVFWKDQLITESKFTITTSIRDQIKLTKILYQNGHIKNKGIVTAIIVQLEIARFWEQLGLKKLRDKTLKQLIKFIEQQSSLPKPKIDDYAKGLLTADLSFISQKQ